MVLDNRHKTLHTVDPSSGKIVGKIRLVGGEDSDGWAGLCVHRCRVSGKLFAVISDVWYDMVHVFDLQRGEKVRSIGEGHHSNPEFLCMHCPPDAPALLLVSEETGHCIGVFDWDSGAHMYSIGEGRGSGPGQMDGPAGIALWTPQDDPDAGAQLVVADCWNHRLQFFRLADGAYLRTIGGEGTEPEHPSALVLHRPAGGRDEDALLIVIGGYAGIYVYRLVSGEYLRSIGGGKGSGVDQLREYGYGAAVYQPPGQPDSETQLIVSDCENNRLQVYNLHSGAHLYSIGRSDTFCYPKGICGGVPEAQDVLK